MNFFVHLNLAATLLVAFIVFVFGIELGKITTVSYSYYGNIYSYGNYKELIIIIILFCH